MQKPIVLAVQVFLKMEDVFGLNATDRSVIFAFGSFENGKGAFYRLRDFPVEVHDYRPEVVRAALEYVHATHRNRGKAPPELTTLEEAVNVPAHLVLTYRHDNEPEKERVRIDLLPLRGDIEVAGVFVERLQAGELLVDEVQHGVWHHHRHIRDEGHDRAFDKKLLLTIAFAHTPARVVMANDEFAKKYALRTENVIRLGYTEVG